MDIKLKNRIGKLLFGSLARELVLVVLGALIAAALVSVSLMQFETGITPKLFVQKANEIFVEVNRYISYQNDKSRIYLDKLSEYYGLNIAVVKPSGTVLLKSYGIEGNQIDLVYIKKLLLGVPSDNGPYYQIYNVTLEKENAVLVVWSDYHEEHRIEYLWFVIATVSFCFILLIYLPIRKKVNYIAYMTKGIKSISKGDLEHKLERVGYDELSVLSEKINEMTSNLKETIAQELATERVKNELITNVSHDLRTPLTSLIAYLKLLNDESLPMDERKKYSDRAYNNAEKLNQLIDDLFEYTKLSGGGKVLSKEQINVIELLEQSIGEVSFFAKEKGIQIKKEYDCSDVYINVDAAKIARVFGNLLLNAIKYGVPNSEIVISIIKGTEVTLHFQNFTDNISPEDMDRIFERFYRVEKSRNSEMSGSGLGLAIAKSIIEQHKGKIWAALEANLFTISIMLPYDIQ